MPDHNNKKYQQLDSRIDAYLNGQLSDHEIDELWSELIGNSDYYDYFKTKVHLKKIFEERASTSSDDSSQSASVHPLPQEQKSKNSDSKRTDSNTTWIWFAAAAAILALVFGLNIFQMSTDTSLSFWTIESIPSGKLESPDIMRSDSGKTKKSDSLLNLGYHAMITGEIDQAEQLYTTIVTKYSNEQSALLAHLNLGILKYNQEHYEKAISHFKSVIESNTPRVRVEEKAYWYMGNAYVNLDELEKARDAVHEAWSINGVYRNPAGRLLRKLDYQLGRVDYDNFEQQQESF